MKSIYVPELIEKIEQLVNEGILSWSEAHNGLCRYVFNFPFSTDTCDIFNSIADFDIKKVKNTKDWNKENNALYIDSVQVFIYHKNDWRREQDEMTNYGWMLKKLKSVEAIISHIKHVYKIAADVWADSQEKILLSAIDAL